MANEEHLAILRQGVKVWNRWREGHPDIQPDLNRSDLSEANLGGVLFRGANLSSIILCGVNLDAAVLSGANLSGANLSRASLIGTSLMGANLIGANLSEADLSGANLIRAVLTGANLINTKLGLTTLGDIDLSEVLGLETVRHFGPSTIGIDTLYHSGGKIPEIFLRGCGLPEVLVEYIPSLIGAFEPIQFYSCFISYSSENDDFVRRLYVSMRDNDIRVWLAPEDMKGGAQLLEQIDQAIRIRDKLVLVLSEQSLRSEWVMTEIRKARKAELRDKRRKLFPIRLVDMDTLRDWECFDADTGKDLAVEVREYFIPDFTKWKDHDSFERAFARFLKDLQATEAPPAPTPAPVQSPTTISRARSVKPQNPQTIIARKKRRLEVLEEQQAVKGISTPPEVITEIEDLRREIAELEDEAL